MPDIKKSLVDKRQNGMEIDAKPNGTSERARAEERYAHVVRMTETEAGSGKAGKRER